MNDYVLSEAADADIQGILIDSITQWGLARAERYILELHEAFRTLSAFPRLGRDAGNIRLGYFQFQYISHSIFYQIIEPGVFIVRILHQKQLSENNL